MLPVVNFCHGVCEMNIPRLNRDLTDGFADKTENQSRYLEPVGQYDERPLVLTAIKNRCRYVAVCMLCLSLRPLDLRI
jgi:hypothetical protein